MPVTVADASDSSDADYDRDDTSGGSDLAQLRKDAEAFAPKPLRYAHPTVPKYTLVFRPDLDWKEMEAWRRKCVTKVARGSRPEEMDSSKFNRLIVSGTSIGVEIRATGEVVRDSDGRGVSFTNREFLATFGAATAADAVKAFIVSDSAIASLANQIIEDNGVGGDVEEVPDPTGDDEN